MNINLRGLRAEDAEAMLEWMHDEEIQLGFQKNMLDMKAEDAKRFIANSQLETGIKDGSDIHYAIVDDRDVYLGTISLKKINLGLKTAEYAVVLRKSFQGKGIASAATRKLFKIAFEDIKLDSIYLYVIEDNLRARKCYRRNGFVFVEKIENSICKEGQWINQEKYMIDKNIYEDGKRLLK